MWASPSWCYIRICTRSCNWTELNWNISFLWWTAQPRTCNSFIHYLLPSSNPLSWRSLWLVRAPAWETRSKCELPQLMLHILDMSIGQEPIGVVDVLSVGLTPPMDLLKNRGEPLYETWNLHLFSTLLPSSNPSSSRNTWVREMF